MRTLFTGALILPDRIVAEGAVLVDGGRVVASGRRQEISDVADSSVDVEEGYLAPGFVDLHCHGGEGADFMDGTDEAFRTILRAHLGHGTTTMAPTTTVADHDQILNALEACHRATGNDGFGLFSQGESCGARVVGAHLYGPYFGPGAEGCHPAAALRLPDPQEYSQYLQFHSGIACATIAPELPGAQAFARAAAVAGIHLHAGHSNATFSEIEAALEWGIRHVDHLFCAMSDRGKLKMDVPFPMRGGLMEAALYFDELTTEVIADGRHLAPELLKLAYRIKGAERLALITDCNRALHMPDGEYVFGPCDGGEPFLRRGGVGVTLDGAGLASGCEGMDHMVRTFVEATGASHVDAVRMASETPARILGIDGEVGSLTSGRRADLLVLTPHLQLTRVFLAGREVVT
ncbi:MAG: amidohydrolase family protein [Candidatus Latescibacterota bacterium]|nr:amidohydrolase family protein [Candidatus Latescibacterota bacterium]